jgi:hypothetical protein
MRMQNERRIRLGSSQVSVSVCRRSIELGIGHAEVAHNPWHAKRLGRIGRLDLLTSSWGMRNAQQQFPPDNT